MRRPPVVVPAVAITVALAALAGCGGGRSTAPRPSAPQTATVPVAPPQPAAASTTDRAPATTPPAAQAAPGAPAESGGPSGAVQAYFAALTRGDTAAAYALLAPPWRSTHPYAAFAASLAGPAPTLVDATIASAANFNATVDVTLRTADGTARRLTVQVVNVDAGPGGPGGGAFATWRLQSPPAIP